jgi:2,4-dienoyl-CoA reductase-like NADH-dependent reductase (Old Yellow Enzyme family)
MKASEPGFIGGLEIRNRIVMAPMISNLANIDGSTNITHISYLEERAKGGAGLIITEYTYIDSINSRGSRNELGAYSLSQVPKLRRIPEAIHPQGAKVFMQLVHSGGKALEGENLRPPMAPSSVDYIGRKPQEMDSNDIESVIKAFENASSIAKRSKFDGIEIHGAHGYLIHEFISPTLNIREDRYGGTFEKRLTFPQEVIDVAKETGLPVGIRLSLYEDDPNGWGADYGIKVAESLKNIDYVHFSAGNFYPPGSSASFYSPQVHVLRRLPRKPNLTTILVGSVINEEDVESVLSVCDFVSVGRGMLADPYFAFKVVNAPKLIRPCIRCNQGCRDLSLGEVRCTVNPDVGYEFIRKERMNGEIALIGAGVQGLEAALYASKIGLKVSLYEKEENIGGQLNKIFDPFKKKAFEPLLEYYRNALNAASVNVQLGMKYDGNAIRCLPEKVYPDLPDDANSFESNIYAHHDAFLKIAKSRKIEVSIKSLESLDRNRKVEYEKIARKEGIIFTERKKYDFVLIEKDQYDIGMAMKAGRQKIDKFLLHSRNDFL